MLGLKITLIGLISVATILVTCPSGVLAEDRIIQSNWADSDSGLDTDPSSLFWRDSLLTYMDADPHGKPDPKHRTEIRTRWTEKNLYFLFVCPYEILNLKPNPNRSAETYELWNWDVAEVFIGDNFKDIRRYKEFEVSPQGEWIDLDINLNKKHHEDGWRWNSGFQVLARIDEAAHVWYGAMKIPYSAIDNRQAAPGNTLRINLFRSQGPPSARHEIAWSSPMSNSFHVPERFGLLKLVKK